MNTGRHAHIWHNYKTGEDVLFEAEGEMNEFIPQDKASQTLYLAYRKGMGMTPLEAAKKVLEAHCGVDDEQAKGLK